MAYNNNMTNEIEQAINKVNQLDKSINNVNNTIDKYNDKTEQASNNTSSYSEDLEALNRELIELSLRQKQKQMKYTYEDLSKSKEKVESYKWIDEHRQSISNRKNEVNNTLKELGFNSDFSNAYMIAKNRASELEDERYEYESGEIDFDESAYNKVVEELEKVTLAIEMMKENIEDTEALDQLIEVYKSLKKEEEAFNISIKNSEKERLASIEEYNKQKAYLEDLEEKDRIKSLKQEIKDKEALLKNKNKENKKVENKNKSIDTGINEDKKIKLEEKLKSLSDSIDRNKIDTFGNIFGASASSINFKNFNSKSLGSSIIKTIIKGFEKDKQLKNEFESLSSELVEAGGDVDTLGVSLAGLSTGAVAAVSAIGAIIIALGIMVKISKEAYERNMTVNRALAQMGINSSDLNNSTSETANQILRIKNNWINIFQDLGTSLLPIFEGLVDIVDILTKAVKLTVEIGTNIYDLFSGKALTDWITGKDKEEQSVRSEEVSKQLKEWNKIYGIPLDSSASTIGSIVSQAKQSGFDNNSATNLAINTYKQAIKLAEQYGLKVEDVADALSDAWLRGSDAAKEYGAVVDDQTLIGFMASQGVDIVNVEITDAMRQYYRYQLLMKETSESNSDAMQQQIKQWKQLGFMIDKTKNKLFSFDEVINLQAVDPEIPIVDSLGEIKDSLDKPLEVKPIITPDGGDTLTPSPLPVEVVPEFSWNDFKLPVLDPVTVLVTATTLGLAGVELLKNAISWLLEKVPVGVKVLATVLGMAAVKLLQGALNTILDFGELAVKILAEVFGIDLVEKFQTLWNSLKAGELTFGLIAEVLGLQDILDFVNNWQLLVGLAVAPLTFGISLLIPALGPLKNFIDNWNEAVNFDVKQLVFNVALSVLGEETLRALNQALANLGEYLGNPQSLVVTLGVVGLELIEDLQTKWEELLAVTQKQVAFAITVGVTGSIALFNSIYNMLQDVGNEWKLNFNVQVLGQDLLDLVLSTLEQISGWADKLDTFLESIGITNSQKEAEKYSETLEEVKRQREEARQTSKQAGEEAANNFVEGFKSGSYGAISAWAPTSAEAYGGGFLGALKADWDLNMTRLGFRDQTKEGYTTSDLRSSTAAFQGANFNPLNMKGAAGAASFAYGTSKVYGGLNALSALGVQSLSGLNFGSVIPATVSAFGFASGGIGTKEINNATLFEGNKKEAVIPLESEAGIRYLSNAMKEAGAGSSETSSNIEVHLSLSGIFDTDDRGKWQELAERLGEAIDIQIQRRGSLGYGATY